MKRFSRIARGLVAGGLSVAMLSAGGLPAFASCASGSCSANSQKTSNEKTTANNPREEMRDARSVMLQEAKAEDAELQTLITDLNKAPEAKKVELEAVILTKLVNQRHEMLTQFENFHAHMAQFRREHARHMEKPGAENGTPQHPTVQR